MTDREADDDYEDEEPTAEELAQIKLATPEDAAAVDALVLSRCTDRWSKVAMIVASSLDEYDAKIPHLPYVYMQLRILNLVDQGLLESQGDVMAMRYSEIRRPKDSRSDA